VYNQGEQLAFEGFKWIFLIEWSFEGFI